MMYKKDIDHKSPFGELWLVIKDTNPKKRCFWEEQEATTTRVKPTSLSLKTQECPLII
jgi:hypothetical protein